MALTDPKTSASGKRARTRPGDDSLTTEELFDEPGPTRQTTSSGEDGPAVDGSTEDGTQDDTAVDGSTEDGTQDDTAVDLDATVDDETPETVLLPKAAPAADEAVAGARRRRTGTTRPRRGRRVTRVVRRVQLWSVFKLALIGSLIFYVICLISVAMLWSLAVSTGQIHHIERFMRDIGFNDWTFDGPVLFLVTVNIGAVSTIVTSVMVTVAAAIMNLVSELTGGIRFTVIEEIDDDNQEVDDEAPRASRSAGL